LIRSRVQALTWHFYLLHKWYEAVDKPGNAIRICLLDFSKAFNRLDHNILLNILKDMDVHPVLLNWIANFLTDKQQKTRVDHFFSEWKYINAGVPQGTKLGPLLSLIMTAQCLMKPLNLWTIPLLGK
jgi:hypothetical protein